MGNTDLPPLSLAVMVLEKSLVVWDSVLPEHHPKVEERTVSIVTASKVHIDNEARSGSRRGHQIRERCRRRF